ncbi:MAG: polyribonucleotide nucleotidyltransferase Pnp [Parcubacteria group bacterium Athens1014_10]|nr:MAG: polyribonucleotide nucleotidyltransferase Pnp [Parcubacteria group bacterium Athens1014_10]TSD05911.1 MAG: polyribonucleotide nucleotidyltransferase Pnp [Parcubacteria group bacterium Athens0714_12]
MIRDEVKFMAIQKFVRELGGRNLIIEVGKLAGLATSSCTVQYGETTVLATVVLSREQREGIDFLPLLVDYEERLYAAGKIKGSRFIKREGRATDEAILTARLIDRAIRPLFPEEIRNDVQVILTVLSFDQENDPDIVSLIAASCALAVSGIPWFGPVGAVRVGRINEEWILNSIYSAREKSDLDLVVAGTKDKVVMLEAGAKEAKEEVVLEAIRFGQKHIEKVISLIEEIKKEIGQEKNLEVLPSFLKSPEDKEKEEELKSKVKEFLNKNLEEGLFNHKIKSKLGRKHKKEELAEKLNNELLEQEIGKEKREKAQTIFKALLEEEISKAILEKDKRVDGRKLDEIRPLNCEVAILPHVHGSALFKRGDTQVLSVVTLGSPGEELHLDTMEESGKKRFMHHYNFPPFSVGEVAPVRGPGRREIGHGALAEKALIPVLPEKDKFPYTIRLVSEVLSSNGSSSMGSVCASCMALMDAGIPIKKPVAGIAMGLASIEENKEIKSYKIFTDLQDLEDSNGGMDFKVAGTKDGITAIQMDTKTNGLTDEIVEKTIFQAKEARLKILEAMSEAIGEPRAELSPYAPRVITLKINPEKIRDVIGPGGKMINEIIEKTGVASIDIEQDGTVFISSLSSSGIDKAVEWVENLTKEAKIGEIFQGRVVKIMDFGAFVEILPKQEGLVHISELAPYRVAKVEDIVKEGEIIPVKVIRIDEQGKISLSLKQAQ